MKALQRNLKNLRVEHGFTAKEICEKSGISMGTYSRLEKGIGDPGIGTINKLCIFYDCTPNFLLCDHSNPEPEVFPPYRHMKGGERVAVYG